MSDDVRERLDALIARGARTFDGPGVGMIASLLDRAEALTPDARAILERRAYARLEALELRFEASETEASRALERLAAIGAGAPELDRARDTGDHVRIARAARRHPEQTPRLRARAIHGWAERLDVEARSRGLRASPGRDPIATASRLYRRSVAGARAARELERTIAALPEDPGRYHATTVAARTLRLVESLAPELLPALVERLEDLAMVEAATRDAEATGKGKPKGKKR